MMFSQTPLFVAQTLSGALGMQMFVYHEDRIPRSLSSAIVVSNHRSFLDAALLIQALRMPVRIACHHYMGQTPFLREMVQLLGCLPLAEPAQRQRQFFEQAHQLLNSGQWVGLFPEGGSPMVELTQPKEVGPFQRGFAHLALQVDVPQLAVLPVAIASLEEQVASAFPIRWLRHFDASEPLFARPGLHPVVVYRRVNVLVGRPYWITSQHRQQYKGKGGKKMAVQLTQYCHREIATLMKDCS